MKHLTADNIRTLLTNQNRIFQSAVFQNIIIDTFNVGMYRKNVGLRGQISRGSVLRRTRSVRQDVKKRGRGRRRLMLRRGQMKTPRRSLPCLAWDPSTAATCRRFFYKPQL